MVNQVSLVGRAGKDPEIRYFESGKSLCKLSLAVNRPKKDDPPDWYDLEMWGRTGEIAADYVRKGSLVGVEGSFKQENWSDRETGSPRTKIVVKVDRIELFSSNKKEVNEE